MTPPASAYGPGPRPPPDAAARAAYRREPIILSGFDRRRQHDIPFGTIPFGAVWLRRTYTNEHHKHVTQRAGYDETCLQEVRYGNNITVLFKACFYLRQFYDLRDFWSAIAKGFGASADVVEDMVELLVDARNMYRRNNPHEVDIDRTGANIAVDKWHIFLMNRKGVVDNDWRHVSAQEVHTRARAFFTESEGKQVDLANVLPKEIDYRHYSPSSSRKRFASPEPPGQPPSPKRRPSANYLDRTEPLPNRPTQSLTPLSTGIYIKGSAKQGYHTPVSATEQNKIPPYDSPSKATEVFRKIRGTASQDSIESPSSSSRDLTLPLALSNSSPDGETQKLRDQLARLEKEVSDVKSRQSNDQALRIRMDEILRERLDQYIKPLEARIATLEKNSTESAARQAQVVQNDRNAKGSISMVKDEAADRTVDLTCSDKLNDNSTLRALGDVQGRLALPEERRLVDKTAEVQVAVAPIEPRVPCVQSTPQESSVSVIQDVTNSPTRLEDKVSITGSLKDNGQIDIGEMWAKYLSLEDRVTKIEIEKGEHNHEIESQVAVIEHEQDRVRRDYATQAFVEAKFEQFDSRLACEIGNVVKQLQGAKTPTTTEIQSSRPIDTVGVPRTLESPPPSQEMQRNLDEIWKTVHSLPTESSVTDMIAKREQVLRSETERLRGIVNEVSRTIKESPTAESVAGMIDKCEHVHDTEIKILRRQLDDMSMKINSLPDRAFVSDKSYRLEQTLRSELERLRNDTQGIVNGSREHLGTMQVQIKGLNKLWNEAMTGIAKSDSLLALKIEVDALKGDVAVQSKRLDISDQGLNKSKDDNVAELEHRVTDLAIQVRTALSGGMSTDLLTQLQEIHSKINAVQSNTGDARVDALLLEVETLHHRTSMLAKALSGVGQLLRPAEC